jgi:hypothetical protein
MPAPIKQIQAFIDSPATLHFIKGAINYQISQIQFPTGNPNIDTNIKLFLQNNGYQVNQIVHKMACIIAGKDNLTIDSDSNDITSAVVNRFNEVFEVDLI